MGYSRKNPNRRGWGYTFLKSPPGNFRFVTLLQEIPEKKSFYPWRLCKFVWHPSEIPKPKTKTHGNSALGFLEHPWNSHFFFNWPLEFPRVFSSRLPEIPCPQPPCLDLFWNSPIIKMQFKVQQILFLCDGETSSSNNMAITGAGIKNTT